jgi:predicted nucleic acid-binding protein
LSGFLLDTNLISELVRPRPNSGVIDWITITEESILHISVLTLGEIRKGIAALAAGRRRSSLESWLEYELASRFSGRILPIDQGIADRWGRISATARSRGAPLPVVDGLLAATALHFNLTVVSRDTTYAAVAGLDLVNPWHS